MDVLPSGASMVIGDNVILVGTAHVSEKSVQEVEDAIAFYKPDVVAVELDDKRYHSLTQGDDGEKEIQIKELLKGNNLAIFLLQLMLSYIQRKVGSEQGVKPGAEMIAAIDAAKRSGIEIALIDRDIGITFARFWNKMSLWEKLKMVGSLIIGSLGFGSDELDIEHITEEDNVSGMVEELRHFAPSAATVLIDERDAYLAHNLVAIGKTRRVLGVVGAGHRNGIIKYIERPDTIPTIESITLVPKKRSLGLTKIALTICVLIAVVIFALLLLSGVPLQELLVAILILFIAKGVLSALFVTVVGGHPKSIATCIVLAWYSLVNPVAHIGWFAGVVEAAERPPTMNDLKTILGNENDTVLQTLKGLYRNKLFKVVMVAALANIGSMIGTILGVALIVYYLHLSDPVGLLQNGITNGYHTAMAGIHTII